MEPSRRERPSIWGGLRSGIGNRLTGFLRRRMVPILVGVAVLVGFFFFTTGAGLPDDGEPIPISADDALVFARNLTDAAGDAPDTRVVDLTMTDRQVTSFLAIAAVLSGELEDAGGTGDLSELAGLGDAIHQDPATVGGWRDLVESQGGIGSVLTRGLDLRLTIREPEVRFTGDGEIIVRGYGKLVFVGIPARIVVTPRIVDGGVEFELVEGRFGRLPLPGAMADLVEGAIERALLAGHSIAAVDDIEVAEGSLRFVGSLQR